MSFPDTVVTRCTGEVDSFLTSLTVFLKRLTTVRFQSGGVEMNNIGDTAGKAKLPVAQGNAIA